MDTHLNQGTVYKKSKGLYTVQTLSGEIVQCTISSRLRKQLIYPTRDRSSLGYLVVDKVEDITVIDPVAVGDIVRFSDAMNNQGHITEVRPRRSKLARRAFGERATEQVIVANVDQVIPVVSVASPKPRWHLVDRYLASAEASAVPVVICLTKLDLVKSKKAEHKIMDVVEDYRNIGYQVILTSMVDGVGIEIMHDLLKGQVSALLGLSGVGKTSLLNAIEPDLGLRVGEVNERIEKGRHTTTHLEMFPLAIGGAVIDTPGIKVFGLWQIESDEVAELFREFASYFGECKFGANCLHDQEPECAIKDAVASGKISQRRYESYLKLRQYIYAQSK